MVFRTIFVHVLRNFRAISGTPSIDLDFDLERQMSGSISWLCKLPREASCRFRLFWFTFRCNFWMMSGTPSFDPEFDLEGQMVNQSSWLCKLPREASYHLGRF